MELDTRLSSEPREKLKNPQNTSMDSILRSKPDTLRLNIDPKLDIADMSKQLSQ
jgi:hypothetical protein